MIDECELIGGKGGDGNSFDSTDGGDGASIVAYAAFMGCTLQGGDSGNGPTPGKNSGNGLVSYASNTGYSNSLRDTVATAGAVVGGGTSGMDVWVQYGPLIQHAAVTRSLVVPTPLREGQQAIATLRGEAGDAAFVLMGSGLHVLPALAKQGANLLGGTLFGPLFVAVLPAGGTAQIPVQLPELPLGIEGVVVFVQPYMLPQAGGVVTGSGSAVVWIDSTL